MVELVRDIRSNFLYDTQKVILEPSFLIVEAKSWTIS